MPTWQALTFLSTCAGLVEAEDQLGGAGWFRLAFDVDRRREDALDGVPRLLHIQQFHREAVVLSILEGRRKADLVEAVVDDHGEVLHLDQLEEEPRDERKGEVSVRHRLPERRLARDS